MAMMSVLLLGVFLSGVGIVDYLSQLRAINGIVEKSLNDNSYKALKRDAVSGALLLDSAALDQYLADVVAQAMTDLAIELPQVLDYRIESRGCAIGIDPLTGVSQGIESGTCADSVAGTLAVPVNVSTLVDFDTEFMRQATQLVSLSGGAGAQASLLAVPQGSYGRDNGEEQYMSRAVLVGLRIFLSLDGSLSGFAFEQFGGTPYVYNRKVSHLRGVLE
jgi:hypothetical protein